MAVDVGARHAEGARDVSDGGLVVAKGAEEVLRDGKNPFVDVGSEYGGGSHVTIFINRHSLHKARFDARD